MIFKSFGTKIRQNKIYNNNPPIDKSVVQQHIVDTVVSRLDGKNPSTDRLVYSQQNFNTTTGGSCIRNVNCWINGVNNISCFSPFSGSGGRFRAGTLISPRHALFATHYRPDLLTGGTPILFVDESNNIIIRRLVRYEADNTDISIGLLDGDISSNIKFAKVLPKNYFSYFAPDPNNNYAVALDAQEKAILKRIFSIYGSSLIDIRGFTSDHPYYAFDEPIITGDSGNPVFLIIDNELVLLTAWWFSTSGPFTTTNYDVINVLMSKLGGGYNLTPIDLKTVYNKYK
jgi:hypothetical protein